MSNASIEHDHCVGLLPCAATAFSTSLWKVKIGRCFRRILARVAVLADLVKRDFVFMGGENQISIEEDADRVGGKRRCRAHPFRRLVPVLKIVYLKLDQVPVWVGIVERCGHAMI